MFGGVGADLASSWDGIVHAAGGVGLFLLGMLVLTEGLTQLAGSLLGRMLARFTRSPSSGALTGAAITAVVQSSSATTVAAVGFVGAGLLTFPQALGIVFGANAGTTLKNWVVALVGFKLELGTLALPLLFMGVILRLFARGRAAKVGFALAGFALLFVGIDFLKMGMGGLGDRLAPEVLPGDTLAGRLALVGIGAGLTAVTQSSSVGVAAALAALHAGRIELPQALALVIGMDVGTTSTALLATLGATAQARRTGAAHVVYNLMTGTVAFLLLTPYAFLLERLGARDPELSLVAFHTGFNLLGVVAVLPFARPFARLIERLVPERGAPLERRLDPTLLSDPAVALAAVSATLDELVPRELEWLARGIAGEGRAATRARAAPEEPAHVGAALEATRAYLARVPTPARDERLHARHESAVHALDHLRRLAQRRARSHVDSGTEDRSLSVAASEVRALLASVVENLQGADEERARALHERLETAEPAYRAEVVDRTARRELDTADALARMDEMRRLRRIVRHVWRIVHHLVLARG